MLLCTVEDAKRTGGRLQLKRLSRAFWIEEYILERLGSLVHCKTCWVSFYCERSLLDSKVMVKIAIEYGSCHETTYVTSWTKNILCFQAQHSSWKSDNDWRVSSCGLWCILFHHNLLFICFCVCERWQMDFLNSPWTWCTFISCCEMKHKERHWKSFVVAEDKSSV